MVFCCQKWIALPKYIGYILFDISVFSCNSVILTDEIYKCVCNGVHSFLKQIQSVHLPFNWQLIISFVIFCFQVLICLFLFENSFFNSETKCNWTRGIVGMKWLGESKNMVLNGRRQGSKFTSEQPVSQTRSQHSQRASLRPNKSHPSSRRCSRSKWDI